MPRPLDGKNWTRPAVPRPIPIVQIHKWAVHGIKWRQETPSQPIQEGVIG